MTDIEKITAKMVLNAYVNGLFPMADSAGSENLYWYDPLLRGQLSITEFRVPRRLQKTIRKYPYDIRLDTAFEDVIKGCAETTDKRLERWSQKFGQCVKLVFMTKGGSII